MCKKDHIMFFSLFAQLKFSLRRILINTKTLLLLHHHDASCREVTKVLIGFFSNDIFKKCCNYNWETVTVHFKMIHIIKNWWLMRKNKLFSTRKDKVCFIEYMQHPKTVCWFNNEWWEFFMSFSALIYNEKGASYILLTYA